MEIFYFALLPLLACIKVTVQGKLSKSNNDRLAGVFRLNFFLFGFAAVVMGIMFLRSLPKKAVIVAALIYSVVNVLFQMFYLIAFSSGSVGLAVVINNFNIVIPIFFGIFMFNEPLTIIRAIGIALMIIPLILLPKSQGDGKINAKWFVFTILAFLSSGLSNALMVICTNSGFTADDTRQIVIFGYVFACAISGVLSLVLSKGKPDENIARDKYSALKMFFVAVAMGLYNVLLSTALHSINSSVLYPIVNVLTMAAVLLYDIIRYKQKLSVKQYIGLAFAAVCVVLLNI